MTALLQTPELTLADVEQERHFITEPVKQCRFCNCSEFAPCRILVREAEDGNFYLAKDESDATEEMACAWFLPGICTAPECMAKLYAELRGEPQFVVFSAGDGRSAR
jgi:hypothetical protein